MTLERLVDFVKRNWGVICALLTGISIAFTQSASKELIHRNTTGIIVVLRSSVQTLISGIALAFTERTLRPDSSDAMYVAGRSILDGFTAYLICKALNYIPLFDQITLFYGTLTIAVTLFAGVLLKEAIGAVTLMTMVMMLVGIVTISQPSFLFHVTTLSSSYYIGVGMCLAGGILQASSMICVRKIRNTGANLASFHVSWVTTIMNLVPLFAFEEFRLSDRVTDYVLIIVAALLVLLTYKCEIDGLRVTDAATFQLISLVELPITLGTNYLWFGDDLNYLEGSGAILIVVGLVVLLCKEYITQKITQCFSPACDVAQSTIDAQEENFPILN